MSKRWMKGIVMSMVLLACFAHLYPSNTENYDQVIRALHYYSLGQGETSSKNVEEAVEYYKQAIQEYNHFGPAYNNMGILLHEQGRNEEAISLHKQAAEYSFLEGDWETFASAHNNLGYMMRHNQEKSYEHTMQAIYHFDLALQVKPPMCSEDVYISLLYNKGSALFGLAKYDEAEKLLQQVLALSPNHGNAHLDLGNIYFHQGRIDRAIEHQDSLVSIGKSMREVVGALNNKGQFLKEVGLVQEAVHTHMQALHLDPSDGNTLLNVITARRQLCDWNEADEWRNRLVALTTKEIQDNEIPSLLPYDATLMELTDDFKKQVAISNSRQWEQSIQIHDAIDSSKRNTIFPLRIAYLSYDFRNHPMGQLTIGALEKHNKTRLHVSAYSYGPNDGSEWRQRAELACTSFRDVFHVADLDVATEIATDGIEIVIDLMAHTRGARVGISGLKPAPTIINYLGYPGTMGSSFTDYTIVDARVVPPTRAIATFTEHLIYLPFTYQVNDYKWATSTRIRQELNGPFIFCNFNTINKMEPLSFDTWMRILHRVPNSILWLLEPSLIDAQVMETFRSEARARGIDPKRLVFAPRVSREEHLTRLQDANLFLDSFIYNAHTTASDMLWTYLPMITTWGDTFASRVASSFIQLSMDTLVWTTHSIKEYEDIAVSLATTNRPLLNHLRQTLATQILKNPLYHTAQTTRHLEEAYMAAASLGTQRMHLVIDPSIRSHGNFKSLSELQDEKIQITLEIHQNGQLNEASLGYNRLLDIYPQHADGLHLYGLLLHEQKKHDAALEHLQEAVAIAPHAGFFHGNLGQVYRALNRYDEALEQYEIALALDSTLLNLVLDAFSLLEIEMNASKAVYLYQEYGEKLFKKVSQEIEWNIRFQIGHAMAMLEEYESAMECIQVIASLASTSIAIRANYTLAALLLKLSRYEEANSISFQTVEMENLFYFKPTISFPRPFHSKPRLVIYCHEYGQSWWPQWGPNSIEEGIGGSEEAVIYLSRELHALGYFVEIYGNPPAPVVDSYGVHWYPHTAFDINESSDIFIAWRYHISTKLGRNAGQIYLWLHDMIDFKSITRNYIETIDGIFCLSKAHIKNIPNYIKNKIILTSNGLNNDSYKIGNNKNTNFVYGSSPGRGLEIILDSWDTIRQYIPNATLNIYYGFTPAFVKYSQISNQWRNKMEKMIQQDGIHYIGLVNHSTLATGYSNAGFYLYPTTFYETSCVSIMKAMVNGAIPITSKRGALKEVVGKYDLGPKEELNGEINIEWKMKWIESIVLAVYSNTTKLRNEMIKYAKNKFSWKKIANEWFKIFKMK